MSDIVERLRYASATGNLPHWPFTLREAADEIERLRAALINNSEWRDENIQVWAEIGRLKAALQACADQRHDACRIARAALEGK